MRKHASRWLLGVICAVIAVVFVFTFGFKQGGLEKTVAQVGPYKISAAEYYQTHSKMEKFFRSLYGDKFDEEAGSQQKLKEMVMNQLLDKYLFLKKAEDMGVKVSGREFGEFLSGIEVFRRNGAFNQQAYEEFLKRNNMEPKTFEDEQKQAMLIEKTLRIILDNGVRMDENAVYAAYLKERGQVKLSVAVFDPAAYRDKVRLDEKEMESLYEKEKGGLRSENMYHVKYILIDDKSGVKDDQAYMELLKSKDMAAYGKSKGLQVVDLGMTKESDLFGRFAGLRPKEWLRGLGRGEFSLPMRDGGKSYIFQMVDRQEGKPLDKSEALKVIAVRVTGEKARVMARLAAEDAIKGGVKFVKDTGFLPKNNPVLPGIGQIPRDGAGIFALPKGKTYDRPVEIGGKYYVFACLDEKQPDKDQWEKEKETYKRIFQTMARDAYLASFKEDLKKSVKVRVYWNEI
jgi:hypothetical protein